jgi:hypothetical protein
MDRRGREALKALVHYVATYDEKPTPRPEPFVLLLTVALFFEQFRQLSAQILERHTLLMAFEVLTATGPILPSLPLVCAERLQANRVLTYCYRDGLRIVDLAFQVLGDGARFASLGPLLKALVQLSRKVFHTHPPSIAPTD